MKPFLLALLAGVGFGSWPLIARYAKVEPTWVTIIVSISTGIWVTTILWYKAPPSNTIEPTDLSVLVLAGAVNALGFYAYGLLVGNAGWEASTYIPIALITTTLVVALGGIVFLQEPLTIKKGLGVMLSLFGIWLVAS